MEEETLAEKKSLSENTYEWNDEEEDHVYNGDDESFYKTPRGVNVYLETDVREAIKEFERLIDISIPKLHGYNGVVKTRIKQVFGEGLCSGGEERKRTTLKLN